MMWSVDVPGLAVGTVLRFELDARSKVANVTLEYSDVFGERKTVTLPVAADQMQRAVNTAAGWPFR